jgi:hypothetical protein
MKSARKILSAAIMLALTLIIARAAFPARAGAYRSRSDATPSLASAPTSVPADNDSGDDDGDEDGGDGSSGY